MKLSTEQRRKLQTDYVLRLVDDMDIELIEEALVKALNEILNYESDDNVLSIITDFYPHLLETLNE